MKNFSLKKIQDLKPSQQVKAVEYISKYFIPLSNGMHAFFNNGKYELIDHLTIKRTYFDRMPKLLSDYYFKTNIDIRTIEYEFGKPELHDDKLNLCPKMKHQMQSYDTFSTDTKKKVDIMLNYVKEVLCSGNKSHYNYLMTWIANMVHGNKNDAILYLRSKQGYGKSTLFEFLSTYVVGDDLSLMTGSEPLLSKNNAILAGKLLVYFEELETFSTQQWMGVSSRLKKQATSPKMVYKNKYEKPYEAKNMNNYAILSNNDAIKDDEGRRYFILDISGHRQIIKGSKTETDNTNFWDSVYACFNNEVGCAFYNYLMEVDIKGFKAQNFPMTDSKIDSFAKRLEPQENFIKHHYILQKLGIKSTVQELYDEFVEFCKKEQRTPFKKIEFGSKLKELGIEYYKTAGNNKYKVSFEFLNELATTRHWIHDIDDYREEEPTKEEQGTLHDDELLCKYTQAEKELKKLKSDYETMRLEFEAYKQEKEQKPKPAIRVIESDDEEEEPCQQVDKLQLNAKPKIELKEKPKKTRTQIQPIEVIKEDLGFIDDEEETPESILDSNVEKLINKMDAEIKANSTVSIIDSDEEVETTVKKPKRKDDKRSKMVQAVEALQTNFIDNPEDDAPKIVERKNVCCAGKNNYKKQWNSFLH